MPRWVGYLGFDAFSSSPTERSGKLPSLWLGRYDALFVWDHHDQRGWLAGETGDACTRLGVKISKGPSLLTGDSQGAAGELLEATPQDLHRGAIGNALERIQRGDLYQVNLARRWLAQYSGHSFDLYRRMRAVGAVPLGAYLDLGREQAVLSRSMETFLRWDGATGKLSTGPIKGTLELQPGTALGEAKARLLNDPKEHAEHVMVVDLMRNDLGRVAQPGTVQVEKFFEVEPYGHLAHAVSTVSCTPREGSTPASILMEMFPPGSVTGTPKVSAVRTIQELETVPRGVFTGAIGYVDHLGGMHWSVAIRTAQALGAGQVEFHAGGGIVAGSDPAKEVAETELKAHVFLRALRI